MSAHHQAKRFSAFNLVLVLLASLSLLAILAARQAHAATLTQVLVRFDRMKVSTATTGTVCVKPTSTATEANVKVTFPTGYTLGIAGTFVVASSSNPNWPSGAAASWPGINTATSVSGQDVTFPSGDLTPGTLYCFDWTNSAAVSVKSGASDSNTGAVTTQTSAPADIDTGSFATSSLTDDQIVVTATVPQSYSLAISANTDSLGTLSTGSVAHSPSPRTATVNTNAKNGWYLWAQDSNTGLKSASASNYTVASTTPGSNSTLSAGTEGYNLGVTAAHGSGTGTVTVPAGYSGVTTSHGGGLDTSLRTIVSSSGTGASDVVTLTNNAAISAITPAATDYTDTITVVGAGLF